MTAEGHKHLVVTDIPAGLTRSGADGNALEVGGEGQRWVVAPSLALESASGRGESKPHLILAHRPPFKCYIYLTYLITIVNVCIYT